MIFCDIASSEPQAFDDLVVFVDHLRECGLDARILRESLPAEMTRNAQFDASGLIASRMPRGGDRIILIASDEIDETRLVHLRRIALGAGGPLEVVAYGRFAGLQAEISASQRLSYVFGSDPLLVNLLEAAPSRKEAGSAPGRAPLLGIAPKAQARRNDRKRVLFLAPSMNGPADIRALRAVTMSRKYASVILTDGKSKAAWQEAAGYEVPAYHYGEALPSQIAGLADIFVALAPVPNSYRMQSLLAALAARGVTLIDAAEGHPTGSLHDGFILGPTEAVLLPGFLAAEILPETGGFGALALSSRAAAEAAPAPVLARIGACLHPSEPAGRADGPVPVVIMPTNGVGLGHAQRTSLIAGALDADRVRPRFAAFPSCMKMLQGYGFDVMPLVSRSPFHAQDHENDLINGARLAALSRDAGAFVFDGGYVFDSVMRAVLGNRLPAVWIRRGLWQPGPNAAIALDREKIFTRVIVPSEAFDELNESYSRGNHVESVGPIVQRLPKDGAKRAALRASLAERYGPFERLVVTMLGGGVAADRKAQIQAIASMMARRRGVLNLLVVWPTATVEAGAFAWPNTRVVKTHHASSLVAAADLYLSAVGYNSFHEAVYNGIPTIFIPQMASFMDDQRARAGSAVERGLAAMVEPHEMMLLDAEIDAFLEGGKADEIRAALAEIPLPEPGNEAAARIIESIVE